MLQNIREHSIWWLLGTMGAVVGFFAGVWPLFTTDTVPEFLARRGLVLSWYRAAGVLLGSAIVALQIAIIWALQRYDLAVAQVDQNASADQRIQLYERRDAPAGRHPNQTLELSREVLSSGEPNVAPRSFVPRPRRQRSLGTVRIQGPLASMRIVNISVTGALLESPGEVPIGTILALDLQLDNDAMIHATARVVRVQFPDWGRIGGIGVVFTEINSASLLALEEFIEPDAVVSEDRIAEQ